MSGTKYFKTNAYITGETSQNEGHFIFKTCYDFLIHLQTNGVTTEVARHNGAGGTGTDFWDGANPFGMPAWATFKFNTHAGRSWEWYLHLAWASGSTIFDDTPNTPSVYNGTSGSSGVSIGFSAAVGVTSAGAATSPWPAAATGSLGSDTKQDPVWAKPVGGSLIVFPISNADGNSHATSRNNMSGFYLGASGATSLRFYCAADLDNIAIWYELNDSTVVASSLFTAGVYTPRTGITNPYPLFSFMNQTSFLDSTPLTFGDTAGTSISQGGISIPNYGVDPATRIFDTNISYDQPNSYVDGGPLYLLDPWELRGPNGRLGTADPDFYRVSGPVPPRANRDVNLDGSKIVISSASTAIDSTLVLPWDNTTPGSGTSRVGNES